MRRQQYLRQGNFWKRGEPLTAYDLEMLRPLLAKAKELGYTPTISEVPAAYKIKSRFRIWNDAVFAAGLPPLNDMDQRRKRKEAQNTLA